MNPNIPMSQSALMVIDAQDSFKATPRWERRNNLRFEQNVSALIELYRSAHLPIFHFLHTDEDEGFSVSSPFFKLMDFIQPRADEPVLLKVTRNVFTSTQLARALTERGVRRLIVTGISTEQCCETSTRVGADLGYDMDFVTEATMTFPIPHRDRPGEELAVDEIVTRTEYALRGRFARIATVAGLRAQLHS